MSVTLSEVTRAAKAHRAPLAGESAGYMVLAVADQVLSAPRLVRAANVQLAEDGALRLLSGAASSDADAEISLRNTLDDLLAVASSGSAALTRAGRRTAPLGLEALVRELEAALIPVNRSAARRALARLHRETARALGSGALSEEARVVDTEGASTAAARDAGEAISSASELLASELEPLQSAPRELAAPELEESDASSATLEPSPCSSPEIQVLPEVRATHRVAPEAEYEFENELDWQLAELEQAEELDSSAVPTVMRALVAQAPLVHVTKDPQPESADFTEVMPEVQPVSPALAMVASRKSDLSALVDSFQVRTEPTNDGLCRVIKDLAELDLTPAPLAALSRCHGATTPKSQ